MTKFLPLFLFLLIINLFITPEVHATNYVCQVKTKDVLKSDEVEHQFSIDSKAGGHGHYAGYMMMFFNKKGYRHMVIKNEKSGIIVSAQFALDQEHLAMKITPHFRINCYSDNKYAAISKGKTNAKLDSEFGESLNLTQFKKDIAIRINRTLKFVYNQKNAQMGMRPVIFYRSKVYTADDDIYEGKDHCTFRVKINSNQDVHLYAGTLLKVKTVNFLKNSGGRWVLSYSFVDPTTGKSDYQFKDLTPFNLNCVYQKQDEFTYKKFKEITSDRVEIGLKK